MAGWLSTSFPPLDPNGEPFSMVLRGTAADLDDLRSALASRPNSRQQLELELEANANGADGEFEDIDDEGIGQEDRLNNGCQSGVIANTQPQAQIEHDITSDGNHDEVTENKKRTRNAEEDDSGIEDEADCEDEMVDQEKLLFYFPSIQCTSSALDMKGVSGDMFVTTIRVLFLAEKQDGEKQFDDLAIDGSCIALHAVDSLNGENDVDMSHQHVYCQLAEPSGDGNDTMGYTSAISMMAPAQINEELDDAFNADENEEGGEEEQHQNGSSEEDGTIEIYFKPTITDSGETANSEIQCNKCQEIFDSLTKLATLNPVGDDDGGGGGGLFSMLSMMAGLDANNGFGGEMVMADHDDESNDDMVVRLGGSNNLVENDDEGSEGAPVGERQAMLQHLDDILVVPSEYEIASSEDGQFDDADEDDEIL